MPSFRAYEKISATLMLATSLCFVASCLNAPGALAQTPTVPPPQETLANTANAEAQRKDIEKILSSIESEWNSHNLSAVMGFYADDYLNNDGLDKTAVSKLTEDFWKTYPDAKSQSTTKEIRVEGNYATIESRDIATGTTAKEMPGIGSKGELQSISEGQLYLKRQGQGWRIIGDRIDYERVKVSFGLAKQVQATFSAPEQVKAGKAYTAKLELNLPTGLTAVGSITSTALQYPQATPDDAWRPMSEPAPDRPLLERVITANNRNRNELLMATVGITNSARNSLMGITFLTRRVNIIPTMQDEPVKAGDKKAETKAADSSGVPPKPEMPKPDGAK